MRDFAREWTDAELEALELRIHGIYAQAANEMQDKLEKSLESYSKENEQRQKAMDDSDASRKLYDEWKQNQALNQTWLRDMVRQLSENAVNADRLMTDMVNDFLPHVYSENSNMQAFALDKSLGFDTGFTLVNEDAVRQLMGMPLMDVGEDQLLREVTWTPSVERLHVQDLRKREVDYPKDMRWNRERFHNAITQGILQGESIPDIVKRTKDVYGRNMNAAIRAARTATTNAENAGRMNTFERAQRLGIDMEIEWLATLDGRTRSAHRELDGQRVQVGESFVNSIGSIRWPGDPQADAANIWNCRCRANGRVVGFDGKRGDWVDERGERWTRLPKGMTYKEWRKAKAVSRDESYKNPSKVQSGFWRKAEQRASDSHVVVDGRDISSTWTPTGDYTYDVRDIIHQQGFDGVPRVVDAEEFEQLAKSARDGGFIMQRAYGAPSQEVLDAYREALYGGDFYVDCSGGHMYGRGMYASWEDGTEPTKAMQRTSEKYAKSHGANVGNIETMTLDKSAKLIEYNDLMDKWEDEKIPKSLREGDDGALAAALGYDGILVDRDKEIVVLNRTKLIIRRPN